MIETIGIWWMWAAFFVFVVLMVAADLLLLGGGRTHRVSVREALGWSLAWIALALAFNALLWWYLDGNAGREIANAKATEFFTGYLIEKSLAVDNIFVWLMLFGYFAIPLSSARDMIFACSAPSSWYREIIAAHGSSPSSTGYSISSAPSCWRPAPRCMVRRSQAGYGKYPCKWMRGTPEDHVKIEGERNFVLREGWR